MFHEMLGKKVEFQLEKNSSLFLLTIKEINSSVLTFFSHNSAELKFEELSTL